MRYRFAASAAVAIVFALGSTMAAEGLKSGPQVGDEVPGPFNVQPLNGPQAGKISCQVCKNGGNPVAMIFARDLSAPLTQLVKKIDDATAENFKARMGSVVVFLGDEDSLKKQVKELADQESIKNCILATMSNPVGPPKYQVAKDAAVTVILYNKLKVEANFVFEKGKLTEKDVEKIVGELSKILPKK